MGVLPLAQEQRADADCQNQDRQTQSGQGDGQPAPLSRLRGGRLFLGSGQFLPVIEQIVYGYAVELAQSGQIFRGGNGRPGIT